MKPTDRPPTIMVVDDTPANPKLLDEMLREWGFHVRLFPRGRLALSSAAADPPDIILLDIFMPEMDGYETCRQFRADPLLESIPIIFISGLSEPMDKVKAFQAGGVDYVTKPFQLEEVRARIEMHLNIKRLQDSRETQNRLLQESNTRLRELEDHRDSLMHMIIHDMRSPLMAISGNLEMLSMEGSPMSADDQESLRQASAAVNRLNGMINSLLDVGRMESGQITLRREPCDLRALAGEVITMLGGLLHQNAVQIVSPAESVTALCDPALIHRVIANLIDNAVKFSPPGQPIVLVFDPSGSGLRVMVKDRGPGIPAAAFSRIFEKFGQVATARQGKRYSTGLGLTFCKLVVEAHGGRIGVDSVMEEGSTFWFTLPAA
jgi:signal transduction histidine kinase